MRRSTRTLLIAAVLLAVATAVLLSRASRASAHVRDQVVTALADRFHGDAALETLQVSVFPRPQISGSGLAVRWNSPSATQPLVQAGSFTASAGVTGVLWTPLRLRQVHVDRLDIRIPPGGLHQAASAHDREDTRRPTRLVIDEIIAHAAQLQIESKKPGKLPRIFEIHDLHILGFGEQDGADFRATLTNPVPSGLVQTTGRFGPWQRDQPRTTPLRGDYRFTNANLDTIKGLSGTLSSQGRYSGSLERIEVTGETNTPDFAIDIAGQPVELSTRFKAIVDGTNGDTYLEEVDARLHESHIHAKGAVVRTEDVKGRNIQLDITIDSARIEDLLTLAVKALKPPLTGAVTVNTKFALPAGEMDVVRRLRLDGDFALDHARFTNFNVQKRINALSRKGKGDDAPDDGASVVSRLRGRFALKDAALSFSNLTFAVPGAMVQLAGTYNLENEALDFAGDLLLDASLREMTSGIKAVVATLAQPFFRRHSGGTRIPIRIEGTRKKPKFGVDVKRALLPG